MGPQGAPLQPKVRCVALAQPEVRCGARAARGSGAGGCRGRARAACGTRARRSGHGGPRLRTCVGMAESTEPVHKQITKRRTWTKKKPNKLADANDAGHYRNIRADIYTLRQCVCTRNVFVAVVCNVLLTAT